MQKPLTIAIDGHSSTGKSTLAKQLAQHLGYVYVDTGAMYRAVALYALRRGWVTPEGQTDEAAIQSALSEMHISFQRDPQGRNTTYLNGENIEDEIRSMTISGVVSHVAKLVPVRRHLVALQQAMGKDGGVVMDGRDIGTVVFPEAELKIFMTASDAVRAERRRKELEENGQHVSAEEVLANLRARDFADSKREDSPLVRADDALELDNSHMDRQSQFELVLGWVAERLPA